MQRKFFQFICICFLALKVQAQRGINNPDSISYSWYVNGQWDSLINNEKALLTSAGLDYYYLRYRIAEAYFQNGDYLKSAEYFRKASKMNPLDTFALLRLHTSLTIFGRFHEAAVEAKKLRKMGAHPNDYAESQLQSFSTEYGIRFSDSDSVGQIEYKAASISIAPLQRLSILGSYQLINQDYFYGSTMQQVMHAKASWFFNKGWRVFANGNLIEIEFVPLEGITRYFSYQSISGGASKYFGKWHSSLELSYSNFNYSDYFQMNLSTGYFPMRNNRLGIFHELILQNNDGNLSVVSKPSLSYRLNNRLYFGLKSFFGNTTNLVENEGYVVSNSLDITKVKAQIQFDYYTSKYLSFFVLGSYESRTEFTLGNAYSLTGFVAGLRLCPGRSIWK
jgi:hypothetical protein